MSTSVRAMIALVAAVALVFTVSACGGPTEAQQKKEALAEKQKQAAAEHAAREKKRKAEEQDRHDRCAEALRDFSDALSEINSRLSVGLNYQEYGDKLGDARVAYDRIDIEGLREISPTCLSAAVPLEDAYNDYLGVLSLWGDCIDDYSCDFSAGETNRKAQNGWKRAGEALETSKTKLDAMAPS